MNHRSRRREIARFTTRLARSLLTLAGLAALIGIIASSLNYVDSVQSAGNLRLELARVQAADDHSYVVVELMLHNPSEIPLDIRRYDFDLYINDRLIGSSFSTYTGGDSGIDFASHRGMLRINQTLGSHETIRLTHTLYIHPTRMEIIDAADNDVAWIVRTYVQAYFPFALRDDPIQITLVDGLER